MLNLKETMVVDAIKQINTIDVNINSLAFSADNNVCVYIANMLCNVLGANVLDIISFNIDDIIINNVTIKNEFTYTFNYSLSNDLFNAIKLA